MADSERDDNLLLPSAQEQIAAGYEDVRSRALTSRTRSASMSFLPSSYMDSYNNLTYHAGHTGPLRSERKMISGTMGGPLHGAPGPENLIRLNQRWREQVERTEQKYPSLSIKDPNDCRDDSCAGRNRNEHLLKSGQLGVCDDPYCTTCPTYYNPKGAKRKTSRTSGKFDLFNKALYGDTKGWARRFSSYISGFIPGVMNPHAKVVQQWNKFFVISWLVSVFVDPLFFFLQGVQSDDMCIVMNKTMTMTLVVVRSVTDFIYSIYILLQFRLAYTDPESTVVGVGDLIDDPKKIALNYLKGYFLIDVFVALPIPQITVLLLRPQYKGLSSAGNYGKNLLRAVMYFPRLCRLLQILADPIGSIFESAWADFVINLLIYVLFGHIIGSSWYLFGLQRVSKCIGRACRSFGTCEFMECGNWDRTGDFNYNKWELWRNNTAAVNCFSGDNRDWYGIYLTSVNLTTKDSIATRYFYSLFWGFQQISTLAGNQVPSYFLGETIFTMTIIGLGLLLFALLIGNMQNFLQALGKRRLEMTLRRHDVERWMRHRRLPVRLRRGVRRAERYNWAATRGINEEMLLENLPEDLQEEIRRHIFSFVKKVRIFSLMDDPMLDVICEKLRHKTYIKGSKILNRNGLIEKMVFIVRGKLQSTGEDGIMDLHEGDVCGEELLAWCLENSTVNEGRGMRVPGQRLHSYRTVKCLTNVEAFALRAADLEEVTRLFPRFFRNPRVQGAIRYISPYWRGLAATRIQVAWRYRKKCQIRANASQPGHPI